VRHRTTRALAALSVPIAVVNPADVPQVHVMELALEPERTPFFRQVTPARLTGLHRPDVAISALVPGTNAREFKLTANLLRLHDDVLEFARIAVFTFTSLERVARLVDLCPLVHVNTAVAIIARSPAIKLTADLVDLRANALLRSNLVDLRANALLTLVFFCDVVEQALVSPPAVSILEVAAGNFRA